MVDVDHRSVPSSTHAQVAGLRRLSARANGSTPAAGAAPAAGPRRLCCFSFAAYARGVIQHLRRCGVSVAPGLSESEFGRIQSHLGFVFPPDLRAILQEGLPVGPSFPDWRSASAAQLKARIEQPVTGLCHEVSRRSFWWNGWGPRPSSADQALKVAAAELKRAPVLVPIYSHCYIPASGAAGNPVLFVRGGEVLCCGNDVADFFEREAFVPEQEYQQQQEFQQEEELDDVAVGHGSCLSSVKSRLGSLRANLESSSGSGSSSSSSSEGSSSWGRSLDTLARNPEAFFSFRRKFKGSAASRMGEQLTSSRSAEATPRPSSVSARSSGVASEPPRRSLDVVSIRRGKKPLPIEALLGLTMAAPAWAAKTPRRIDFWSDLADRCYEDEHDEEQHAPLVSSKDEVPELDSSKDEVPELDSSKDEVPERDSSKDEVPELDSSKDEVPELDSSKDEVPQLDSSKDEVPQLDSSKDEVPQLVAPAASNQEIPKQSTMQQKKVQNAAEEQKQQQQQQGWLDGYLHDMAGRLRTAGWKEDDISEMMVTTDPSGDPGSAGNPTIQAAQQEQQQSRQSVKQSLAFKVGELSDSLKKAGWSVQDVAEALGASSLSVWAAAFDHQQQQQQQQQIRMPMMAKSSKLNSPRFAAAADSIGTGLARGMLEAC